MKRVCIGRVKTHMPKLYDKIKGTLVHFILRKSRETFYSRFVKYILPDGSPILWEKKTKLKRSKWYGARSKNVSQTWFCAKLMPSSNHCS